MRNAKSKNIKKSQVGNRKAGPRKQKERILELSLVKTYPNQVVWETWLPATPQKLTTTVTTGVITMTQSVRANLIASFATRFGSTFVEYRIIRAKFGLRFFSSVNPGVVQFWIDEKISGAPSLAEAQERATLVCSASAVDTTPMLKWVNGDPLDLQYIAINTTNTNLATFKGYTDFANFGASVVATDYFEVEPFYQFQFRGLQGV